MLVVSALASAVDAVCCCPAFVLVVAWALVSAFPLALLLIYSDELVFVVSLAGILSVSDSSDADVCLANGGS